MVQFLEMLKLPPVILSAIVLASGMILFLPSHIIRRLYMVEFKETYGFAIGLSFIISISILVCYLIVTVHKKIKSKICEHKSNIRKNEIVSTLDEYEKEIMREFMKRGDRIVYLSMNNGIVRTLQNKMLITPAGTSH